MISKVSIRNFKCLRDVQIDLERFTVFVGPNASGKSSILQALDLLCRLFQPQPGHAARELAQATASGSSQAAVLAGTVDTGCYGYQGAAPRNPDHGVGVNLGTAKVEPRQGNFVAPELNSEERRPWPSTQPAHSPLPYSVLLRLEASKLAIAHFPQDPTPSIMKPDGSSLHSALAGIALNEPDLWKQLQLDLHRIIPTIRRLRHTKTAPASLLFDTVGGDGLSAQQVSEGTLLVLGLLAALYSTEHPSLLLFDDLDRGLHPKAQKELISLLRGLLAAKPDLQIIATTHSPYLLDCMSPSEVRMTLLRDNGATICAPLDHNPDFENWKDEMSPGELWSLFGEKWLAEQEANS